MSYLSYVILPEPLRAISATTFTGSYQPVGGPLLSGGRLIRFQNASNVPIFLSWDGVTDHNYFPAGSFMIIDISTNHENSLVFEAQAGTQFYVRGSAGTGSFYIESFYGS